MTNLRNHAGFHVPEPLDRHGQAADFSRFEIPAPGACPQPPIDVDPAEIRQLPFVLIRVLDDEGRAVGDWAPQVETSVLVAGLRAMVKTRAYDSRMLRMQRQGKASFYMKSTGEEAVAVAAALALERQDMCFPTYRQQGILIAREWSLVDMMNQVYSNRGDRLKGRQMPVFYSSREAGFFSISGNLGTQYCQAVGWALGAAGDGSSAIAAAWIGEGATAEGDFHYALTFASVYQAPVILNIVNNQWAISSFSGIAGSERTTFAARGLGYGLPSLRVDGNDFLAVFAATEWAASRARLGHGPTVIEHFTYRAEGHSTSDDPSKYRGNTNDGGWPLGDPILRLKQHLIALGEWSEEAHGNLETETDEEVKAAGRISEGLGTLREGERLPVSTMFDDVYKEMPSHLLSQLNEVLKK